MNPSRSLDDVISKEAIAFANQIKQAADFAHNEEEIRVEVEKALSFIQREVGIKLEGRHEFTVGTGRADSVYDCVIIEYKSPASQNRLSDKSDATGNRKVVEQLKKRFYDMRTEFGHPLNTMLGVGCDGNYFIFLRFRDDKWEIQEPVEVSRYSAERFLWALFNLGTKGKAFAPEYLAGDFGSDAKLAQEGIRTLYDTISSTPNPKAQTFFQQWKILFSEVCGYDVNSPSSKIRKLGDFYGVYGTPKPAELLFAVHTYYALFMKLLASEIVAFFHQLPPPLQKIIQAGTSNKLKREMEELEAGSIFRYLNITNFLEGDLFAWYPSTWCEPIEKLVRDMVARLDGYNPGTLQEDPAGSRDLLKKLYQQLFPRSVRHDLGEYYTPDWLAEHVLDELEYIGDPDKRLLDPACGSGTFLVMAINRIRKWYDNNREHCAYNEGGLCRKILQNIIGFDLNPLAVMAARTNYLISIHDLIGYMADVEIPVYLCDSIMTPAEYGGLTAGGRLGDIKELKTSAARFLIPTEITMNRDHVAKYAEQLEFCVRNGYSPEEFIERCQDESLPVSIENLHIDLYKELLKLDKESKNGVWARIIKNAFAPLFVERVDYIAGNPPWVRWSYLPDEYCQASWHLWESYELFQARGHKARVNAGELDLSMLFTYSCIDNYLTENGLLGFVITEEVWRSKVAGLGFRRFRIRQDGPYFQIKAVHDFVEVKPFEGAANKTTTFVAIKGVKTAYPVPFYKYDRLKGTKQLPESDTWFRWQKQLNREALVANPVTDELSAWEVRSSSMPDLSRALSTPSFYKARLGVRLDPYGVYLLRLLGCYEDYILVKNAPELGRKEIPCVEAKLEQELIFPALLGRHIKRWYASPELLTIVPNRGINKADLISYEEMKRRLPNTYSYFHQFWDVLAEKEDYWTYFSQIVEGSDDDVLDQRYLHWRRRNKPTRGGIRQVVQASDVPLYSVSKVGSYTFQPYRVVWPRMASDLRAAVISKSSVNIGEHHTAVKTVIPNDVVTLVGFDSVEDAHYFCACMNSAIVRKHLLSFSSPGRGFAPPSILDSIGIGKFSESDPNMIQLARLSQQCHCAAHRGDSDSLEVLESEVDKAAAQLWGVTDDELKAIQDALTEI